MTETKYKIHIKSIQGTILHFTDVVSYELKEGLIIFEDTFSGKTKRFPVSNCEIEEMKGVSQ